MFTAITGKRGRPRGRMEIQQIRALRRDTSKHVVTQIYIPTLLRRFHNSSVHSEGKYDSCRSLLATTFRPAEKEEEEEGHKAKTGIRSY